MRALPVLAVFLLIATPLPAQPKTESNIGLTQYPAPKCDVPQAVDPSLKPSAPPENPSEAQASIYNSRIRAYNAAMRTHNDGVKVYATCIEGYIAAAKADIGRIQAGMDSAVAAANQQ